MLTNHLLDFGHRGLVETLDALFTAGLRAVGAGRDADEACKPAMVPLGGGRRVLVSSFGLSSSGIPRTWAAAPGRAGIDVIPELSDATAEEVTARVRRAKRPGDLVVASVHWGSNWGYDVDDDQIRFARRLIDGGVDVVHGHSSHHPRPVEVYRDRLVLYGCGDFINDYEGITGYEMYRDDLRLAYFVSAGVSVDPPGATLTGLRMVPLQTRRMRLWRAAPEDAGWLRGVLTRISRGFGTRFDLNAPGVLSLRQP
nr:CapA family protein [Frankia sp. KB5]